MSLLINHNLLARDFNGLKWSDVILLPHFQPWLGSIFVGMRKIVRSQEIELIPVSAILKNESGKWKT